MVAPELLRFPYHVRYELHRVRGLLPRGARPAAWCRCTRPASPAAGEERWCSARAVRASRPSCCTACAPGCAFLAEDSVLVRARGLLATGVANFLHVRADSLRFLAGTPLARQIRAAPVIRAAQWRAASTNSTCAAATSASPARRCRCRRWCSCPRAAPATGRCCAGCRPRRWRRACAARSPTPRTSQGGEPFSCGRGGCRPSSCAAGRTRARRWRRWRSCSTGRTGGRARKGLSAQAR